MRAGPDDGELLGCDRLARVAEHLGVLERDVRQHHDRRVEDVRRVEAAAEAGLDDGGVDLPRGELGERGGRQHLELRRARGVRPHARERAPRGRRRAPSTWIRSDQPRTCGEMYAPTRSPSARSSAAVISVVDVLPFVPTTWIDGIRALRVAERGEQRAHPPEPELLGPRRQALEPAEVASRRRAPRARAGSARASRARPRRRLGGAFATNRSFASIPSARAISFCSRARSAVDVAVRLARRSGLTTASKIRFSSPSSATRTPLRRNVAAASCTRSSAAAAAGIAAIRARATAPTISRAVVELRPDLLGHVRHHRVEQREQPLERGERGRDRARRRRRRAAA